jgi:hypothetical protein
VVDYFDDIGVTSRMQTEFGQTRYRKKSPVIYEIDG